MIGRIRKRSWRFGLMGGGLALLAVYAFSRRLVGPLWALAPMIALGLSMPMVYFSRAIH